MAALRDIRAGIAANLAEIVGFQVSPYMLGNPTPPTMQVMGPDEITFDAASRRGADRITVVVQAFAGIWSDVGAQQVVDGLLDGEGAGSVKAAVEADRTLGGVVDDCRVARASGYRVYVLSGVEVLGCEFQLEVLT